MNAMHRSHDSPKHAMREMGSSVEALEQLSTLLAAASEYVDKVVSGESQPNTEVGIRLFEMVRASADLDPEEFSQTYNTALQDNLMAAYLANITRHQLVMSDTLQKTLN